MIRHKLKEWFLRITTADRKWSCGHPGSRQWTTRREIEFWLSLVSHSFIKLQIITASLAHFCAGNGKIRGKVFYVPNSVFDCQNVCWEDDEMNSMRECSSFAVWGVLAKLFCMRTTFLPLLSEVLLRCEKRLFNSPFVLKTSSKGGKEDLFSIFNQIVLDLQFTTSPARCDGETAKDIFRKK